MKAVLVKLALFAALMALAVLTAPDWQRLDHLAFQPLVVPAATPHKDLLLLEVPDLAPEDPLSARFRQEVGRTLLELARRRPDQVPAKVLVDIEFGARGAPLDTVVQGLVELKRKNVQVFMARDADTPPGELAGELYDAVPLDGVGHTELRLAGGLWYFRTRSKENPATGKTLYFLPARVADVAGLNELPAYQVIRVPPVGPGPGLGRTLAQVDASWQGMTVVVASSQRECRMARQGVGTALCRGEAGSLNWGGPELLLWSLTDLMQQGTPRIYQPVHSPVWRLVAALACAALAVALHQLALRWAGRHWSPTQLRRRLPAISLGALLLAWAALGLAVGLLVALQWLLPPTLPAMAALFAVALAHGHVHMHLEEQLSAIDRRAADQTIQAEVDVFISYSHAPGNRAWVEREIVAPLQAMRLSDGRALRLFFDRDDITVGQQWFKRINLSILGSRCFLCVWSDDYLERDYCRWELDYAFPRAARSDFLFLPVARLPPETLAGPAYAPYVQVRQYVDALNRPDFMDDVRQALRHHLDRPGPA